MDWKQKERKQTAADVYAQGALKFPWHAAACCSSQVLSTFHSRLLHNINPGAVLPGTSPLGEVGRLSLEAAGDLSLEVEAHLTPPKPCHMGIDQGFR